MRVSSDLPTTVLPFSLNSTGIVAACAVLMRSIGHLSPKPGTDHHFPAHSCPHARQAKKIVVCPRFARNLLREVFHHRKHRVGGGLPQPAYGCVHHRIGKFLQQRLIPFLSFDELERLCRADPAGRALPARFLGEELHEIPRGGRGFVFIREDNYRGGADKAAILVQRIEVERDIAHRRRKDPTRGSAGKIAVELVAFQHPAAVFGDQLLHRDSGRRKVYAGLLHAPAHREGAQALAAVEPVRGETVDAIFQDFTHTVQTHLVVLLSYTTYIQLRPEGKPAPPSPRRPESSITAITSSRFFAPSMQALASSYPPFARYAA